MKTKLDKSDWLFLVGAVLVVVGVAIHYRAAAVVTAGLFLLCVPLLEVIASFIRGLRS